MDVCKHMDHPAAEVHTDSLAASQKGIEHGGILRGAVVSGKKIIFSAKTEAPQCIFRQIVVDF